MKTLALIILTLGLNAQTTFREWRYAHDDVFHFYGAFFTDEAAYQVQSFAFPKMPEVKKILISNAVTFGVIFAKERWDMIKKHPTGFSWDDVFIGSWSVPIYDICNAVRFDVKYRQELTKIDEGYFENLSTFTQQQNDTTMAKTNQKTKLTLLERILIPGILKKETDYKSLIVIRDLKAKIELKQEELKKYDVQVREGGLMTWNKKGIDAVFEYDFTELEKLEIKLALSKLDEDKKLTEEFTSLYEKFVK